MSPPQFDERELRAAQAIEAVLLFGAFVFRLPLLVAAVAVVVGLGAAFGPRANAFHLVYRLAVDARVKPSGLWVAPVAARSLDLVAFVLLLIALGGFALDLDGAAWVPTLIVAIVAAVAATTSYNAALALYERVRRDR
jgi:hypothetical protein